MAVGAGRVIAGPLVRKACGRHIADLESGTARGLIWRLDRAMHAMEFFPDVLRLPDVETDAVSGEEVIRFEDAEPFNLEGWQKFIIGSLFGWYWGDGARRFRVGYIEVGKGNGKTPLAAGIGLYMQNADGQPKAECYAAAAIKDQAKVQYRDAVNMVQASDDLQAIVEQHGQKEVYNLVNRRNGSFYKPISAEKRGLDGKRVHFAGIDEVHEHPNALVCDKMRAGTKGRRNALIFEITNSGFDRTSVCYQHHEYSERVLNGLVPLSDSDSWFAYVCALDTVKVVGTDGKEHEQTEDPLSDESCWPKANPNLGVSIQLRYLRDQVSEARGMPSKESIVRRLNFCQWTGAESPWISVEVWKQAYQPFDIEALRGRRAVAALDLSSTTDLTGLVFLVEPTEENEPWKLVPFAWLPDADLARKSQTDLRSDAYVQWVSKGFLLTTPGRAISKRVVLQKLSAMCDFFEVIACAYDRWRIEDLLALAADDGISLPAMKPFGQGYKDMSPALETFERMLLNGEIAHNGNPVMNMCISNAVTDSDGAGNRKLDKQRATGRIDLTVCAVMTAGAIGALFGDAEGDLNDFLANPIIA